MKKLLIVTGLFLTLSVSAYADDSCPDDKFLLEKVGILALKNNSVVEFNGVQWIAEIPGSFPEEVSTIQYLSKKENDCAYIAYSKTERPVEFMLKLSQNPMRRTVKK